MARDQLLNTFLSLSIHHSFVSHSRFFPFFCILAAQKAEIYSCANDHPNVRPAFFIFVRFFLVLALIEIVTQKA